MERTLKTMGLHPTYLEAFKATHDKILSEEVPISALDRHHIALMVSQKLLCMHPWLLGDDPHFLQVHIFYNILDSGVHIFYNNFEY